MDSFRLADLDKQVFSVTDSNRLRLAESVVQSKSTRSQKPKLSTVKQVTKWMGDHYVLGFAGRRPEISQESKSVQILQKSFG